MATYGNVEEFKESDESWTQYAVRHKQYFAANEIKDAKKPWRAILLSVCGFKTCGLIRGVDKSYDIYTGILVSLIPIYHESAKKIWAKGRQEDRRQP